MQALKTVLPALTKVLGTSVHQAYERQRALTNAGLLKARPGRGPGSGVPATPKNLAQLLVALLVGDLRESSIERIKAVSGARAAAGICPFTQTHRFVDALSAIIENGKAKMDHWPLRISVSRDKPHAAVIWPINGDFPVDYTPTGKYVDIPESRLRLEATIGGGTLWEIHKLLFDVNGELL